MGGREAAGGLRDSCHVGLFSPETQTDCSAAGMGQLEVTGLRARAGLAPTVFASESRASDREGTGC